MLTTLIGQKKPGDQVNKDHNPEQNELEVWDNLARAAGVELNDCDEIDPPFEGWLDAELLATLSGAMRELRFTFCYPDRFTRKYHDYSCGLNVICVSEGEITLGLYEGTLDAFNRDEKWFRVTVPMKWLQEAISARALAEKIYSSACWTLADASHVDIGDDGSNEYEPSDAEVDQWHWSRGVGLNRTHSNT